MSVDQGLLFTGAKSDVEHHLTSASQQATQNQRADQAGVHSTTPSTPPGHRSSGRQLDPRHRIALPSATPECNGFDNVGYWHASNPLRSPRKPQGAQKEHDIDRVESGKTYISAPQTHGRTIPPLRPSLSPVRKRRHLDRGNPSIAIAKAI